MLARSSEVLPQGDGWAYEVKWDGIRIIARVAGGEARLTSRGGNDVTGRHAEIAAALVEALGGRDAVVDGELCALDDEGRPRFSLLQQGLGARVLYAFDLLELDGESLCDRPLAERRALLDEILTPNDEVHVSQWFDDGAGLLALASSHGLEGVVAKQRSSVYQPDKRPGAWVKVKIAQEGIFVIAGYTRGQGRRENALGALVLAERGPEGLVWAGNVGTGLTDAEIDRLTALLKPLATPTCPLAVVPRMPRIRRGDLTWVEPRLQCRVTYHERTHEGRLRAPVYRGLVEETATQRLERPVAELRDGKRILVLRNLDKVWWPEEGITKGDVLDHYRALADIVVPHLRGRPFTMLRYPDGIEGNRFFQKDAPKGTPEWVHLAPLPAGGRTIRFPVLNDELSLLWAVNMGCIDLNVWCAREDKPERPDVVIFDLDPAPPAGFDEARQVALLVRDVLASVDLRGYPRTSGSLRGMHVLVPIVRRHTHQQARELVASVGAALEHAHPGLVTTRWAKTERKGVLIDANQNGYGRTTAWAYSVRPRPGALVATPVTWDELEQPLDTRKFTMAEVQQRVRRLGDLHRPVLEDAQSLGKALKALR
jgi:bifunctional non-homologous end joining protein LigD